MTYFMISDSGLEVNKKIHPRVRKMYSGIAVILSRYRSGKLPKAFKVIPVLKNWEQVAIGN